jgi:hypothetical protein
LHRAACIAQCNDGRVRTRRQAEPRNANNQAQGVCCRTSAAAAAGLAFRFAALLFDAIVQVCLLSTHCCWPTGLLPLRQFAAQPCQRFLGVRHQETAASAQSRGGQGQTPEGEEQKE